MASPRGTLRWATASPVPLPILTLLLLIVIKQSEYRTTPFSPHLNQAPVWFCQPKNKLSISCANPRFFPRLHARRAHTTHAASSTCDVCCMQRFSKSCVIRSQQAAAVGTDSACRQISFNQLKPKPSPTWFVSTFSLPFVFRFFLCFCVPRKGFSNQASLLPCAGE